MTGGLRGRSIASVIADAVATIDVLRERGEDVADEWQYVTDLAAAWTARLRAVEAAGGTAVVPLAVAEAIEAAGAEARLVDDPHRAIDWLSTYPQIVAVALGERP